MAQAEEVLSVGNVTVTKQAPSRIMEDCKRNPQLSGISDVLLNCKSHYLHQSVGAQLSQNCQKCLNKGEREESNGRK